MENKKLIKKLKKEQIKLNKKLWKLHFLSLTKKIVRLLAAIILIC